MSESSSADTWALGDLCTPWCVHVAVTLRIAEHLAAGKTRIDELAAAAQAHPDALHRMLRHLVSKGLFEEPAHGQFALNEPARKLLDSGARIGFDLDGFGGRMAYAWGTLLSAVRTGAPAYHKVFGNSFWDDLRANPPIAEAFDALMGPAGHGTPDTDVLLDGDWNSVHTVVDVGGGTGSLLAEILRAHPHLTGTLVDMPHTVSRSAEVFRAAGVSNRAKAIGQSFFDPLPAGADLYLLKSVVCDWPDHEAVVILRRCAEAARPAGRVLVLSGVQENGDGPIPSLLMLVLVGGKDRTLGEFRPLAESAGLKVHAAGRRPSGRFVIECRPK